MTEPPFTPRYANVNIGSAATLSPTCFIDVIVRMPAMAAPADDSSAVFSLGAHSEAISGYLAIFSSISVLGVPGYAEANLTPASYAPRAAASFPVINCFIFYSLIPAVPEITVYPFQIIVYKNRLK